MDSRKRKWTEMENNIDAVFFLSYSEHRIRQKPVGNFYFRKFGTFLKIKELFLNKSLKTFEVVLGIMCNPRMPHLTP